MKKVIFIVLGCLCLFYVGKCAYQIACISCTTLPIKIYGYNKGMDELESAFNKFADNRNDVKIITSHRGPDKYDAIDITFTVNHAGKHLKYVAGIRDFNGSTEFTLDEVYDADRNVGGYNTDDPEVKALFDEFKHYFLPLLKEKGGIELHPQFFNF